MKADQNDIMSVGITDIITRYVNENAVNGTLLQKTEATLGVVTWKVSHCGNEN